MLRCSYGYLLFYSVTCTLHQVVSGANTNLSKLRTVFRFFRHLPGTTVQLREIFGLCDHWLWPTNREEMLPSENIFADSRYNFRWLIISYPLHYHPGAWHTSLSIIDHTLKNPHKMLLWDISKTTGGVKLSAFVLTFVAVN